MSILDTVLTEYYPSMLTEYYPGAWRPLPGWDTTHQLSDRGDVWSLPRIPVSPGRPRKNGPLAHSYDKDGYHEVCLYGNGKRKVARVHQLVAFVFLPPPEFEDMQVRHLDDDKNNNSVTNLAYGTDSQNKQDALRNGKNSNARKTHCKNNHLLSGINLYINPSGARQCRECVRLSHATA